MQNIGLFGRAFLQKRPVILQNVVSCTEDDNKRLADGRVELTAQDRRCRLRCSCAYVSVGRYMYVDT